MAFVDERFGKDAQSLGFIRRLIKNALRNLAREFRITPPDGVLSDGKV
jgi:hypothetical protein